MTVVGAPNQVDVSYLRITQKQESDLEFLRRVAIEHDYDFTVRGAQLVFYSRALLQSQPAALTLHRNTVERFSFVARPIGFTNRLKLPTSIRRASSFIRKPPRPVPSSRPVTC